MNYSWANRNAASDWLHRKVGGDLPKNYKKVKTRRTVGQNGMKVRQKYKSLSFVQEGSPT